MAHDFNNILTVVGGYTELARESAAEPAAVREYLDEIEAAVERCSGLITHLLVFSRGQLQNPQLVDWNLLLAGMERMLRLLAGESIELSVVPGEALGLVRADPGQLEQVVVNLVLNSRDAMPAGGRISVETDNAEFAVDPSDRGAPRGPCVRLRVRDTGGGMDAETRDRIFEPFFTTKPGKGTGLGLSTLNAIVRRAGGTISVESARGRGTTISIDLPRATGMPADLDRGAAERQIPGGHETLLLVDDEDQVRAVTREILEHRGYTVLTARHGEEAIEICRRHAGPIAALLTDMVMPGMGGGELAEEVRKLRPELRATIFLSGYARGEDRRGLPDDSAFLRKPYTLSGLLRTVRRALDLGVSP
jgi:CheY-like chemotaxis protein